MRVVVALIFVTLFGSSAVAQETAGKHCFEITSPEPNVAPRSLVLLDKCTGSSWLLYRAPLNDKQGNQQIFTYRWAPITVEKSEPKLQSRFQ